MISLFNVNVMEKGTNKLTRESYLNIEFKNYNKELIDKQKKRIEYNYDLNMDYFTSLKSEIFDDYLNDFIQKNGFVEITDLADYKGVPGVYIMVLDQYKQVYIGITESGIKERIQKHWSRKMECDRLIFGPVYNSRLSINSFGALDTTRIFVKTEIEENLYIMEKKIVAEFDDRYLLNRTAGGIGNIGTDAGDELAVQLEISATRTKRDYSSFINEKELYDICDPYEIMMYKSEKGK